MPVLRTHSLILLFSLMLLSCSPEKEVVTWNLLPKPQQAILHGKQQHRLTDGKINPALIRETRVDAIPGVAVNPDEAYRLHITKDSVLIEAVTKTGFYRARQTLNQLIASSGGNTIPALVITDWPAFRVRGFMHDVGRSFISVEELKKQISLLSQFKINVFHWHLTENQGWRLESKRYPQLNDSNSFSRLPGQYYTIDDAREIAAYCRAHHMLLIPEIDMPGHSAAFVRAMGTDMQSEKGKKILKDLMDEICTDVFPDLPWIHIGTDEVQFTNPSFVPEMVAHIRSLGKKVISWNPGWKYQPGEIDATQLWSYRGKAQPGIPAIDSRFHYINHFDVFGDIVALYNSRIYDADQGSDDLAGSILAVWNDRMLPHESDIVLQNSFYPHMLAFSERSWLGGGSEYFDKNGVILPTDENVEVFKSFADFERRMLWYKEHHFVGEPFPYVKQTHVKWLVTDPFPNEGDLSAVFPPDSALSDNYRYLGKEYGVHPATGAGIYLRHVWGNIVPAFYKDPQENHTAYAYTAVWSPKEQTVGLWVSTQDYSRSESDLPPPPGEWDYRESRIFVNNKIIAPPVWENNHTEKTNEVTLKNENFTARPPIAIPLKKGWNKVLLKLPVGKFSTPEVRLQKWMYTFVFVTPDGKSAMPGLIYDPYRHQGSKANNSKTMQINWEKLSTDGLQGNLAKGVSAAYAALINNNKLIVAGGANFPGKQGFEGGSKAFYNQIMLYDEIKKEWTEIGQLPEPAAYGVSVQTTEGALWIGGNNASRSLNNVYSVSLLENDSVALESLPALPVPMDNFAGCASGDLVFVGGGNVDGTPSNAFFCIDTKTDSAWTELPSFPGNPRVQPLMVSIVEEGKEYVYLLGGFFGGDATTEPAMATTVLQYDVATKVWTEAGIQTDPETGKPFSLGGATALPFENRYILCLGGVNHDVFLDAVTTQYQIGHNPALSPEEKQKQNLEFSKKYMTQTVTYYRFNRECRIFDTKTGEWSTLDSTSDAARAGATLVGKDNHFYAIQGELKPGVRSPETFRGEIHF